MLPLEAAESDAAITVNAPLLAKLIAREPVAAPLTLLLNNTSPLLRSITTPDVVLIASMRLACVSSALLGAWLVPPPTTLPGSTIAPIPDVARSVSSLVSSRKITSCVVGNAAKVPEFCADKIAPACAFSVTLPVASTPPSKPLVLRNSIPF